MNLIPGVPAIIVTLVLSFTSRLGVLHAAETASLTISGDAAGNGFPLVTAQSAATIWTDANDDPVTQTAAKLFAADLERVTGHAGHLTSDRKALPSTSLVIGTIGHSTLIDELISSGKINVDAIRGKWESYQIAVVERPTDQLDRALVIVGSDRRGTAFGVFSLSEAIGVSPWYWWADVPTPHRDELYLKPTTYTQGPPSIKYRGIFINDELCLYDWAKSTFDPELKNIGPKTYAKVFELLLRLKANYCWPAMHSHSGTAAFNTIPENFQVAKDYAIVMGSSHCEQMMRNNVGEWDDKKDGPFNYLTNRKRMDDYWRESARFSAKREVTYTLGLRDVHDAPMLGVSVDDVPKLVEVASQAIDSQRKILAEEVTPDLSTIPQLLCTYKEVLLMYQNGLHPPDDVTLLWADDNYGYIRQLSNPEEQKRSGGSGVYYHLSALCTPAGWLWLSSNSPMFISYEMTKAYNHGADRIWVFNIGDLKPAEKELSFAMDLAWNINSWKPQDAHLYAAAWATKTFGKEHAEEIGAMLNEFYALAAGGKPEHMHRIEFSEPEIEKRLARYRALCATSELLLAKMPKEQHDAYFQLIHYPIAGARWSNEHYLLAEQSRLFAAQGDEKALALSEAIAKADRQITDVTDYYNNVMSGGKWKGIMAPWKYLYETIPPKADAKLLDLARQAPKSQSFEIPVTPQNNGSDQPPAGPLTFSWESEKAGKTTLWIKAVKPSQTFNQIKARVNDYTWEPKLYHYGFTWHTTLTAPMWFNLGEVDLRKGHNEVAFTLSDPTVISTVYLGPTEPLPPPARTTLAAADFARKGDGAESQIQVFPGLGSVAGVGIMPFTAPSIDVQDSAKASWVEYDVDLKAGDNTLDILTLPTLRIHAGRHVRYSVTIDGKPQGSFDIQSEEFSPAWQENAIRNYASRKISYPSKEAKRISLRVSLCDPGLILDRILVY